MTTYSIPEDLLLQSVADEMVILDPNSGNYFTLDSIGSRLITLFRDNSDIDLTAEKMAAEYEASKEQIAGDLTALLEEMVGQGLASKG